MVIICNVIFLRLTEILILLVTAFRDGSVLGHITLQNITFIKSHTYTYGCMHTNVCSEASTA